MRQVNGTSPEARTGGSGEQLQALLLEWRELFRHGLDEAEAYTREHPATGLTLAFVAGTFFGSLLARR